jgi:hypothetical protein
MSPFRVYNASRCNDSVSAESSLELIVCDKGSYHVSVDVAPIGGQVKLGTEIDIALAARCFGAVRDGKYREIQCSDYFQRVGSRGQRFPHGAIAPIVSDAHRRGRRVLRSSQTEMGACPSGSQAGMRLARHSPGGCTLPIVKARKKEFASS